jgi:hypothetical protein
MKVQLWTSGIIVIISVFLVNNFTILRHFEKYLELLFQKDVLPGERQEKHLKVPLWQE